jgi:uncharacterized protein YoxC
MYNIQELAQQIVDTKNQIETEIKTIRSARENLDNIQNMAQTLANGFQDLQGAMKEYLEQNNTLIRDTSREQLTTIDEKFGESFSQMQDTQRQVTEFVQNNSEMIAAINKLNGELPRLNLTDKFSELTANFHNQVQELHGALNVIETANRENAKKLASLKQDNQKIAELLTNKIDSSTKEIGQEVMEITTQVKGLYKYAKDELSIMARSDKSIMANQQGLQAALTDLFDTSKKGLGEIKTSTNSIIWVLVLNGIIILLLLFR